MDNPSGIITFKVPDNYQEVIDYTMKTRISFEDIRKAAPANREKIKTALYGVLNNCRFENCTPNKNYIEALGLSVSKSNK